MRNMHKPDKTGQSRETRKPAVFGIAILSPVACCHDRIHVTPA